jgi:MSHA biogenesis protein MshI
VIRKFFSRFGASNAPGWLAVELGEASVSLAHVVHDGGQPVVQFAEERDWDPAEPKSLEQVAREFGVKRFQCTTLLKPQEYNILLVEAPAVKPEELKAAVRWRIKDMLDYHVDDATIDVLDVPAIKGPQRPATMYAVVSKSDRLRQLIARFEAAGIDLAVIDVPDSAQRNIAALYESPQRALLTLSFDADGGLMTITSAGELYVCRKLDGHQRALDRVLIEVQRSLDHFERNFSQLTVERVLVAPMQESEALVAHLGGHLQLPVAAMDLIDVMDLPPAYLAAPADIRARWFRLIGAGLRVEGAVL